MAAVVKNSHRRHRNAEPTAYPTNKSYVSKRGFQAEQIQNYTPNAHRNTCVRNLRQQVLLTSGRDPLVLRLQFEMIQVRPLLLSIHLPIMHIKRWGHFKQPQNAKQFCTRC
jgi:hypothetical protein